MSRLLVLLLVLVAVIAAVGAASAEKDDVPQPVAGATAAVTPVLSPRRVPGLLAAPVADRRLVAALDAVVARQPGSVCLTVASSGRPVFSREAAQPLVPASLAKLLTAVAALEVLGPDHRYTTRVLAAAPPDEAGVVAGDVWLVGGGDPLLATAAYAARFRNQPQIVTPLESLADAVVAAGVRRIDGAVLGDESRYDDDRYPDPWPARYVNQDQSGPLSALGVNDAWETFPPNPDARVPDETAAAEPAEHAARVFALLLAERGVTVGGASGASAAPADAVELAAVDSPPMSEVVTELLRESDNRTGELLLKEVAVARGRPGTTADGAAVVAEVVDDLAPPQPFVADGSGLATDNRVTCTAVQSVLDRYGPDSPLAAALAVAGVNGTLTRRFVESPVRGRLVAKTGTLNAVSSLAGFLPTARGATITFAFIVNLVPPDEVAGVFTEEIDEPELALQDELLAVLDAYPQGPDLVDLGPRT